MKIRAIIPVVALLIATSGCGDDGSSNGTQPGDGQQTTTTRPVEEVDLSDVEWEDHTGEDQVTVQARDDTFLPQYIEVSVGTEIVFTNVGRNDHNVLPAIPDDFEAIDVEDLEPGDQASLTFDQPGDHPYYCSLHGTRTAGMIGAIRVVE